MRQVGQVLQSFGFRDHRLSQEAGGEIFTHLRRQLTFWYSAVLAAMLLLSGVILYFSVYHSLMDPVQQSLISRANDLALHWQHRPDQPYGDQPLLYNDGLTFSNGQAFLTACYTPDGSYILNIYTSGTSKDADGAESPFVESSLVSRALENGTATGTINDGGDYGTVYLYARVVPDPFGNGILGVVQVGELVNTQETVLNGLLVLLIILGAATLVGAVMGGLLLADRALAPARLAFARQQSFIADASHELRTPLTLMRADAEVLLSGRERLDPDDVALLEDIVTEAGHMGRWRTIC